MTATPITFPLTTNPGLTAANAALRAYLASTAK